jgi:hypothetical protein
MAPMASMRFMLPLSGVLTVLAGIVGFVFRGATGAIGAAAGVMLISACLCCRPGPSPGPT